MRSGKDCLTAVSLTLDHTTVEYSRTKLSDRLVYEAVTLKLLVTTISALIVDEHDGNDAYYTLNPVTRCSRDGCVAYAPLKKKLQRILLVPTHIQLASIYVDTAGSEDMTISLINSEDELLGSAYEHVSNTAMLVVGVGKRTEGEVWNQVNRFIGPKVRLKNPRTVYSFPVGGLT